jgi:hypothetical protein
LEIALYDRSGKPIAYVVDEEGTIYLWNGQAVAYLSDDLVYGFNGKHLGWFIDEVMYDKQGSKIGFTDNTCPTVRLIEPIKSIKHIKSIKNICYIPNIRPILSIGYSHNDLEEFLQNGK